MPSTRMARNLGGHLPGVICSSPAIGADGTLYMGSDDFDLNAIGDPALPLSALALSAMPASPQLANTPITYTATATGGSNVSYQFWLFDAAATPAWRQLPGNMSSATCSWTPAAPGNYLIYASAQDGGSGMAVNAISLYTIGNPLTAVSAAPSLASPQPLDRPITFTASATGGINVQFQYWLYDPDGKSGMEPIASIFGIGDLSMDTGYSGQLCHIRHRTRCHRRDSQYILPVYYRHAVDRGQRHPIARLAATGQYTNYLDRDGDRREQCAVPVLALQPDGHPGVEPIARLFIVGNLSVEPRLLRATMSYP